MSFELFTTVLAKYDIYLEPLAIRGAAVRSRQQSAEREEMALRLHDGALCPPLQAVCLRCERPFVLA